MIHKPAASSGHAKAPGSTTGAWHAILQHSASQVEPAWSKGRGVQGASGEAGVVGEGSAPPLSRLALLARPLLPCTRRSRGMDEVSICRTEEQNGAMRQLSQQRPLLHT